MNSSTIFVLIFIFICYAVFEQFTSNRNRKKYCEMIDTLHSMEREHFKRVRVLLERAEVLNRKISQNIEETYEVAKIVKELSEALNEQQK